MYSDFAGFIVSISNLGVWDDLRDVLDESPVISELQIVVQLGVRVKRISFFISNYFSQVVEGVIGGKVDGIDIGRAFFLNLNLVIHKGFFENLNF